MKPAFQEYFRILIGEEEAEQFFYSIEKKETRRSVRVNTLKTGKGFLKEWLLSQGYEVSESLYSSNGLVLEGRGKELALKLPYHAGFTYPQDEASMFAVELLDPKPGEFVLDLTAAPGGKSTHMAARMQNTGVLVANDLDTRRLKALHSNLERLGIWNAVVTRMPPHKLAEFYPEFFDRILLDPSCSGEGLFVTYDGKPNFWNKKSLDRYASAQFGLLVSALKLLKVGGRLVYSTCTLNTIENNGVVERILKKIPGVEVEKVETGRAPEQIGAFKGIRFWPHKTKTKGFFCIALTKTMSFDLEQSSARFERIKFLNEQEVRKAGDLIFESFGCKLPEAVFSLKDGVLFVHSSELQKFPFLPNSSFSFPLLKVYEDKLRPTHAGALFFGLHAKKKVYELSSEEVLAAFERQPIPNKGTKEGLYLAKYKNFPIGLAKVTEVRVEIPFPHQY